ncbi:MAG TPA: TonB-dependent receptor plug domain-containing protein [Flavitalea sp.]|nr:TonB-dependent receptor plug domain-containing protein [Flavitalea sp.]
MIVKIVLMLNASVCLLISSSAQIVSDSAISILEKVVINHELQTYKVNDPSASLRIATSLKSFPQNIQVVTSKTIDDQQIIDMADGVVRNVSGAAASIHESWGNYANITMRGGSITSFRNGMNVKMPWGPLTEDMSMVDRIEFVKGPATFMYSNGEGSGLYNVVTKKPTGKNSNEVRLTYGSFDLTRIAVDIDGTLNKHSTLLARLNVMGKCMKSHRQFDFNNRFAVAPVITFRPDDKTLLTAEYNFQHVKMAALGAAYLFSLKMGDLPRNNSMLEPNLEPTFINDHHLFVTTDHRFSEYFKINAQVAWMKLNQTGSSVWPAFPVGLQNDGSLTRSISNWDALSEIIQGQIHIISKFSTGIIDHHLLGGVDMSYNRYYADFYQLFNISGYDEEENSVPFNIYSPVHGMIAEDALPQFDRRISLKQRGYYRPSQKGSGLYVHDEIHFCGDKLRLTIAGRYTGLIQRNDDVYSNDKRLTPRLAISYNLPNATTAYILYDCSFTGQPGVDSSMNVFKPLTATNIEGGLKRHWLQDKMNFIISIYRLTRSNMIIILPGFGNKAVQTKQTKTQGIEFDIKGDMSRHIAVIANYSYTVCSITKSSDQSNSGNEADLLGSAKHIANAWINYRIADQWNVSLGYQWQGRRLSHLPDYHRADANVSFRMKHLTIALNANNLLNSYLYAGAPFEFNNDISSSEYYFQVEPGINFRACVAYRF